jgi:para-nitrobenzyl esterase
MMTRGEMRAIIGLVLVCAAVVASRAQTDPIANVTGGQIRGTALGGGAVFRGIPFAAPPTGERRWREPMAVQPWTGVRDATKFGAICPQAPTPIVGEAIKTASEDCLFLNVWTPQWLTADAARPVMVWIPGGGNFAGAASQAVYDGEPLARRGVVLVTLNYRLGSLGFFSHPALTRESPHKASGNQGILDQIAALRWVRDNIARFGGDPKNVTIFGESAGSLDVSVLMTSPLSKGLFHRAIAESGAVVLVGEPSTLAEAEKRGQAAASRWKVPGDASLGALRAVSTGDILTAEPNLFGEGIANMFPNLGITVDGYVFPGKPAQVFAAGGQHRVPLLMGSNAREQVPGSVLAKDLPQAITNAYGPLAPRALKLYVGEPDPIYGTTAEQWGTDTSFRCSTVAQAMWHAAAGNRAFEYEFALVPPERAALGATHASELAHVFGTYAQGLVAVGPPARATEVDARVSDLMQRYWTNFAKTSDPNGPGLPKWPKFTAKSRDYVEFATSGATAKQGLRRPYCDLFMENVQRVIGK